MPLGGAVLGGAALTAGAGIWGANKAANAQTTAANNALNAQMAMFQIEQANAAPFISAGKNVLPTLLSLQQGGPEAQNTLNSLPGFQFAQNWGNWAAQNAGTTRGLGGNVLTAAEQFSSGLASNTYQGIINSLLGTATLGSNAAQGLNTNATAVGGQVGSNLIGAGNAQAGAAIAGANAIGGASGSLGNYALLQQVLGNRNMYGTPTSQWPGGGASSVSQ